MAEFKRNVYLKSTDLGIVNREFFKMLDTLIETEEIEVINSLNRITSKPAFAKVSSPHYNASAMDGIVVRARDTYDASDINPIRLRKEIEFEYIDTGDVIPNNYDSVIMIEDIVIIDDVTIEIFKAAYPWQDVRPVGEDISVLEMIVPQNLKIRPVDIGALLTGGVTHLEVYKKLKVGIIPTGTEIVEPGINLEPGNIIESNSRVLEALLIEKGMIPKRYEIVIDDYEILKNVINNAVNENDMVLINAGSSAGSEDYSSLIINELGKVIFHGINIRPGKPAITGIIDGKPIIGIPGFPVSAYIVYEQIVEVLIDNLYHQTIKKQKINAKLSRRIMSSIKSEEFVRVKLGEVNGKIIASPLNRGAGVTMSLVRADGFLRIPKNIEGLDAEAEVEIEMMNPRGSINNTIVSIGSHDIILDILTNVISSNYNGIYFSSSHQGSFAGLMAMKRNTAHIAPVHLLDEKTGVYNETFIERYLEKNEYALIKGIKRKQGLYVLKGNPKNIKGIKDLSKDDIVFVNRQKGSGTRILFDYQLKLSNILPSDIIGYSREMNTHTTVAAAVLSGTADVAMGIHSVADALGLDFIPIGDEDYDFIVKQSDLETEKIKVFINALTSDEFKRDVNKLKGYVFEKTGKIIKL